MHGVPRSPAGRFGSGGGCGRRDLGHALLRPARLDRPARAARRAGSAGTAVLAAPPGTGKTMLVPLALAETGLRVIVAEPRRLAARAAPHRMA